MRAPPPPLPLPPTATRLFREKIQQKPLLLRPSSPPPSNARAARQRTRAAKLARRKTQKPKPLSAKAKRMLGVHEVPKEQRKYAIFEGLNRMWEGYMRDILGVGEGGQGKGRQITAQGAGQILVSADFHGAEVEVVRSRCVSRVGLRGIVVKDTKFTFEIVTRGNELKTVPKEHTVFRFEVPLADQVEYGKEPAQLPKPLIFELHGSQFENRAPDRANKKFKLHIPPDL
ncbi:hypothetical protein H2199_003539 [Coniosporium tulheliwenetii]|uniref:Uncharacterized protein n=1 Tax=Coniosporium tulheliwenetii TaxID=3383036 RepID=A0ACC2ZA00_9PEZI|nr:hypothetical protein H2199_003539 [Cladosporium sp. JES 115]